MLFTRRFWDGLGDGTVTVAFRWWRRPTVRAGGTLKVPVGVIAIDAIEIVAPDSITDADAQRAGFTDRTALLAELDKMNDGSDRDLYRITFHFAGDDPRRELAARNDLDTSELAAVQQKLDRLDRASTDGPWTVATLQLIADRPEVAAGELAATVDRERDVFKRDVRKLKNLGLTISCAVGYRISPRGVAVLAATSERK